MKGIAILIFLAYGFSSCQTSTAQSSTNETPAKFTVHAEIMPLETAVNVAVGNQSVTACFDQCRLQITLNFCGQALIEYPGKSPDVYPAQVFQLQPGVWLADLGAGQYVKIFAATGTAQMDIGGEFQMLIPASNLPVKE